MSTEESTDDRMPLRRPEAALGLSIGALGAVAVVAALLAVNHAKLHYRDRVQCDMKLSASFFSVAAIVMLALAMVSIVMQGVHDTTPQ
jgi:multisubunit Na+/H+ antiporter MnhB subunit